MKAFFAREQLAHAPQQFMRIGRIEAPEDLPSRAEALLGALAHCGVPLAAPEDYGREPLEMVHSTAYLDFLETAYARWQALEIPGLKPGIEVLPNLSPYYGGRVECADRGVCPSDYVVAQAGWYVGDLSSPIGPHTWTSALRSAHTAMAAARAVCAGEGVAYALCRPSGHHAHRDQAVGFCYINNNAIAAETLARHFGRVAVLDVDAHHGDGTQQIFYDRADVLTVSTHGDPGRYYPFYTGYADERGTGAGTGFNLNLPMPHGSGNAVYLETVERGLEAVRAYRPQALVLALGFDTYKDDPISVLGADFDGYREVGRRVGALGLPTVVVQEGGYMVSAIGGALEAFLHGLTGVRG